MRFHSYEIWRIANEASERAVAECSRSLAFEEYSADAIIAIAMSVASAEAFINEFALSIEMFRHPGSWKTVDERFRVAADVLAELESGHAGVQTKFLVAAQVLGIPLERGTNPFQDFATVVSLRNSCVHLKGDHMMTSGRDGVSKRPKWLIGLEQRGLVYKVGRVVMSPFDAIQTPQLATWACATVRDLARHFLRHCPNDSRLRIFLGIKGNWLGASYSVRRPRS
jgi:hypothetical protein